jgi:uncharacterized protein (DUF488 family)
MPSFSEKYAERRARNAPALAALGMAARDTEGGRRFRTIKEGAGATIFTIGYERRDGEELVSALREAGVTTLIDVRDKPISRVSDFRENSLRARCGASKIHYESWRELGSTEEQRERLKNTGDFGRFSEEFRTHAKRRLKEPLKRLADRLRSPGASIALLCYERCHDDCHRSLIANLVAEQVDISIVAIL